MQAVHKSSGAGGGALAVRSSEYSAHNLTALDVIMTGCVVQECHVDTDSGVDLTPGKMQNVHASGGAIFGLVHHIVSFTFTRCQFGSSSAVARGVGRAFGGALSFLTWATPSSHRGLLRLHMSQVDIVNCTARGRHVAVG